jgi:hypothetical protein
MHREVALRFWWEQAEAEIDELRSTPPRGSSSGW